MEKYPSNINVRPRGGHRESGFGGVSEWSISYRASSCTSRAEDVGSPQFRHQTLGRMGKR